MPPRLSASTWGSPVHPPSPCPPSIHRQHTVSSRRSTSGSAKQHGRGDEEPRSCGSPSSRSGDGKSPMPVRVVPLQS
nr:hypothetical protein CFP56_21900 [Quercus suber]